MLAGGAAVGLINGVGVALFGVPPIIMTLAANVILQGLILVYTGGSPAAVRARRSSSSSPSAASAPSR